MTESKMPMNQLPLSHAFNLIKHGPVVLVPRDKQAEESSVNQDENAGGGSRR